MRLKIGDRRRLDAVSKRLLVRPLVSGARYFATLGSLALKSNHGGRGSFASYLAFVDVAGFLKHYPPFAGLPDEQLQPWPTRSKTPTSPKGRRSFAAMRTPPKVMFVIRKGAVEVRVEDIILDRTWPMAQSG